MNVALLRFLVLLVVAPAEIEPLLILGLLVDNLTHLMVVTLYRGVTLLKIVYLPQATFLTVSAPHLRTGTLRQSRGIQVSALMVTLMNGGIPPTDRLIKLPPTVL